MNSGDAEYLKVLVQDLLNERKQKPSMRAVLSLAVSDFLLVASGALVSTCFANDLKVTGYFTLFLIALGLYLRAKAFSLFRILS